MSPASPAPIPLTTRNRFLWAGGLSVLAWVVLQWVSPGAAIVRTPAMSRAAWAMDSAMHMVAEYCQEAGIPVDRGLDPHGTCLIGPELSPLVTSLGQVEAKRTTLTPDLAALLVHLLSRAGVEEGDRVAVGASGSFPGLLVATLVGVEALGARALPILSLGASSFGASRPDLTLLDLFAVLHSRGLVSADLLGVTPGGEDDVGRDLDPSFRDTLLAELEREGLPVLLEPDLRENVEQRLKLYGPVDVFVNVGGAQANLGTSPQILHLPPGITDGTVDLPPEGQRGVVFEMLSRGVPVIHLLHVQGLALRYGLPWDPMPLPVPGSVRLRDGRQDKGVGFWVISMGYLVSLGLVFLTGRGRSV